MRTLMLVFLLGSTAAGKEHWDKKYDSVGILYVQFAGQHWRYGTAFVVDVPGRKNVIVSANHVIKGAAKLMFVSGDFRANVTVLDSHQERDWCVLLLDRPADGVIPLELRREPVRNGEWAFAIGHGGHYWGYTTLRARGASFTGGAKIQFGDSGSPIIDGQRRVLSLVSMVYWDSGDTYGWHGLREWVLSTVKEKR